VHVDPTAYRLALGRLEQLPKQPAQAVAGRLALAPAHEQRKPRLGQPLDESLERLAPKKPRCPRYDEPLSQARASHS